MISDYKDINSSKESYETLRKQLEVLAGSAESELELMTQDDALTTTSLSHFASDLDGPSTSGSSSSSALSNSPQLSEAIAFVKTAFPRIPEKEIAKVLLENPEEVWTTNTPNHGAAQADMDRVMQAMMSLEYVKDLEERGLETLSNDDSMNHEQDNGDSRVQVTQPKAKKFTKGRKMRINDIRQQHHFEPTVRRENGRMNRHENVKGGVVLDPWAQTESLGDFFSQLVPGSKATTFQSCLHDPKYTSPAAAIRAGLVSLHSSSPKKREEEDDQSLVNFLRFLHETNVSYDDLTFEELNRLVEDSKMALRLCEGPQQAYQLVSRLIELDVDATRGMTQGVYHSQVQAAVPNATSASPQAKNTVWTASQEIHPSKDPPTIRKAIESPAGQWFTIPIKPVKIEHPYAQNIPAYNNHSRNDSTSSTKGRNTARTRREIAIYNKKISEARREEILQQASHYFRQGHSVGGTKGRGGEVALFYADRARHLAEVSRKWGMESARAKIAESRANGGERGTVDLHGFSVEEALVGVEEVLALGEDGCSQGMYPLYVESLGLKQSLDRPLRLITGVGRHSLNKAGLLAPALIKQLSQDGWDVRRFDAGLTVHGKVANHRR